MIDVEDKCYICGEKLEPVDGKFNSLMGNKVCNSCWRWNEDSEKDNNHEDKTSGRRLRVLGIILIVLALILGAAGWALLRVLP